MAAAQETESMPDPGEAAERPSFTTVDPATGAAGRSYETCWPITPANEA